MPFFAEFLGGLTAGRSVGWVLKEWKEDSTHTIHGSWYIYLQEWLMFMVFHVVKYTSPIDCLKVYLSVL